MLDTLMRTPAADAPAAKFTKEQARQWGWHPSTVQRFLCSVRSETVSETRVSWPSRQWGLSHWQKRKKQRTGGPGKILRSTPKCLWTIVEPTDFRPRGVVHEPPPAPHASADLSAAASDAACTGA